MHVDDKKVAVNLSKTIIILLSIMVVLIVIANIVV